MKIANIKGAYFKHSLPDKAFHQSVVQIEHSYEEAKKLTKAVSTSLTKAQQKSAINTFLASEQTKLVCAIEAAKKRKPGQRPSLEECLSAAKLSPVELVNEKSIFRLFPKFGGGYRIIHEFGAARRTAQQVALRAIQQIIIPRHFQFTSRGIKQLISSTKKDIQNGNLFFATLDIKDHFGSFDQKKLTTMLPLPKEWVDHVVSGRHLKVSLRKTEYTKSLPLSYSCLCSLARQGAPQGSICSPIVGEYSTSFLNWKSLPSRALSNYSDNYLLLAPSESALVMAIDELVEAVAALPGGNFKLQLLSKGCLKDECTFVGHAIKINSGTVCVTVSSVAEQKLFAKMAQLDLELTKAQNLTEAEHCIGKQSHFCNGWLNAFSECDDIEEYKATLALLVKQNASPLGINAKALIDPSSPEIKLWSSDYSYH